MRKKIGKKKDSPKKRQYYDRSIYDLAVAFERQFFSHTSAFAGKGSEDVGSKPVVSENRVKYD